MATYVIGDVQGCFVTLQRLLDRVRFDAGDDRLWFAGDLVNRGPGSLEVLRWARDHDRCVTAVLGNHDIYLLARAADLVRRRRSDTLTEVLEAPDREALIGWLRERPLLHREGKTVMIHAGFLPEWTVDVAEGLAREASALLREPAGAFLWELFRHRAPPRWSDSLAALDRVAATVHGLTRLRMLTLDGRICDFSGPPSEAPSGCVPWYEHPARSSQDALIVFGHWAALGLHVSDNAVALDTGAVWGGKLTALRLDDRALFQEPTAEGDGR